MTDPTLATDASPAAPTESAAPDIAPAPEVGALAELAELTDRHMRLAAEFDNYRKRVMRELAELEDRAQSKLVGRLLDALDDLDRVASSDPATTGLEAVRGDKDKLPALQKLLSTPPAPGGRRGSSTVFSAKRSARSRFGDSGGFGPAISPGTVFGIG